MLQINETIALPDEELSWSYARSGGPGGQNVNKVASKAVLRWAMASSPSVPASVKLRLTSRHPSRITTEGDFLVVSQKYRDQERNRLDCLEKLETMIRTAAIPPTPRKPTRPTRGSKQRRLQEKRRNAERKADRKGPSGE